MKNTLMLFAVLFGALLTSGYAATKDGYQPATVISVESRAISSNSAADDPSDAPLQPEVYSYDIGILLGGTVYQTRYDSPFADVSSAIAPNHSIQVSLKKHVMDVKLSGDRAVQMAIESHASVKSASGKINN